MDKNKQRLAAIWLISGFVFTILLFVSFALANMWLVCICLIIGTISLYIGFFYLASAKGYPGVLGILLGLRSPGALVALPDESETKDKIVTRLVLYSSMALGGIGLIILTFYFISLFSISHYPDDYWMGVVGGGLTLLSMAFAFIITRPKIKEWLK